MLIAHRVVVTTMPGHVRSPAGHGTPAAARRTAVTLYSGQPVSVSVCWEVSALTAASGKWKAANTVPGATSGVIRAVSV